MPQNKPMKIQWITVNGRQVPLVLPQTYSYEIEDWKVTSDRDPLPVVEYGTTEGGVIVPKRVSDEGHELTQLTGSLTEYKEILLANSIVITDTNYHHYDGGNWDAQTAQQAKPIDNFNKYKYRRFLVINSLDQPLELELLHNFRASHTYDNLLYGPNAEPQTVTLPNKGQYSPYAIDANIIPSLDGILGGNVTVRVRAKVAPTTGSFKLSIVMWN